MLLEIILLTTLFFAIGATIGSFLNVVLYRSLIGEQWWLGRSMCDSCQKQIHWYDNIPILSYLILKGKCRFCRKSIGLAYPVIELLMGVLLVWWYWFGSFFFHLSTEPFTMIQPVFWLVVGVLLIMVVMADLLYLLIPDVVVGILLILTIGYRVSLTMTGVMQPIDLLYSVMGMVIMLAFFGGLWLLTKGKGMGMGDVKLVVPLSLLLGWPKIVVGMFLAFLFGAIVGVGLIVSGTRKRKQVVPFGPFLVMGTIVALLIGEELVRWYMLLL